MKASSFRFDMPFLIEVTFKRNSEFKFKSELTMQNSYSIGIKQGDDNSALVELSLNIECENDNSPFSMHIKNGAVFHWDNYEPAQVDRLLKINAPALLLGYLRPIVSNLTNSAGLPPYNLPFMNFTV